MKSEKNIFIAFILNLLFSFIEFIGGIVTGSIAIISDSVHDFGDAVSIGISYFMEKKSKKKADNNYTYGYVKNLPYENVSNNNRMTGIVGEYLGRVFNEVKRRPGYFVNRKEMGAEVEIREDSHE